MYSTIHSKKLRTYQGGAVRTEGAASPTVVYRDKRLTPWRVIHTVTSAILVVVIRDRPPLALHSGKNGRRHGGKAHINPKRILIFKLKKTYHNPGSEPGYIHKKNRYILGTY